MILLKCPAGEIKVSRASLNFLGDSLKVPESAAFSVSGLMKGDRYSTTVKVMMVAELQAEARRRYFASDAVLSGERT